MESYSGLSAGSRVISFEVPWQQAPEFLPATFGQPVAEFLGVVLAAWHDGAGGQDSQFTLEQVEECDGAVKTVHEQHMVLVDDLLVLHEMVDNTAS